MHIEYFSNPSYVLFGVVVLGDEAVRRAEFLFGMEWRSGGFASGIFGLFGRCSGSFLFPGIRSASSWVLTFDSLQIHYFLLALLFENASHPSLILGLCEAGVMLS